MVLDFEDGVALNQKPNARRLVADLLSKGDFGRSERTVRINSIKAGDDLYVILSNVPRKVAFLPLADFSSFFPTELSWI